MKTNTGIVILNKIVSVQLASLPDGFFTKPTLNWKVWSQDARKAVCEVAYRTSGFSWDAAYSLVLNEEETVGDMGGWVTIDNRSGKKYENVKLKLIAGDVNVVSDFEMDMDFEDDELEEEAEIAYDESASFSEKSFADYHLYTLSETVTLNDFSQKQIEFIPKVYGMQLRKFNQIVINAGGYDQTGLKASSKVQLNNSADLGLGIPLPKGVVRVFKEDEGSLEFIGEDSIDHTPRN